MIHASKIAKVLCIYTLSFLISEAAYASDPQTEIEEILVTGSKRDTSLIDSDLSATIMDSNFIDQARLRDFTRIDDLAPNVQFNESGQRGSIFITVRGVESNPFIVNRAAVYIDGIPFRELSSSVLNQIDSIEVLRGPQGTLYGANSESGLILVNTKTPNDELAGNIRLTGGKFSSGESLEADGYLAGSVADNLAASLSFKTAREDAYVKNLGSTNGESGHIDENFLQSRLRWTPTENLTLNATAYWLDVDAPGFFRQQYIPLDIDRYNQFYANSLNGGREISEWTALESAPKYTTAEELVAGMSLNYQLEHGSIDIAASYRKQEEDSKGLDFDLTASPIVSGAEEDNDTYKNIELRYTSPESDHFDYIVGASYYTSENENTKATFFGNGGLDSYKAAPKQLKSGQDLGIFGSANWHITSKLRLGMGLRFDQAKRDTRQTAGQLDLGFGTIVEYRDAQLERKFDELLPRLALHYKIHDDFSVHASTARGYIPGGFNLTAVQAGFDNEDFVSYDSETLWSQEIGFKWRSSDRALRASGAVFNIRSNNWQELQIATDANGRPVSTDFVGSDASIRSRGIELEAHWKPNNALSIDGHLGYVDAKYRNLQLDENINVKGQPIQFVPKYDGGLAIRYEWGNGFYVRSEMGVTGKTLLRARGDAIQKSVTNYGLQLGYQGQNYGVRLFGENLSDERRASGLAIENLAFGTDGIFYSPIDAPKVVGLEIETWF